MKMKPLEVKALLLKDFNLMLTGYMRAEEREWNRTRHLMSFILNYGGVGSKDYHTPQSIMPLDMDAENTKRLITTMKQAIQLFKEFR